MIVPTASIDTPMRPVLSCAGSHDDAPRAPCPIMQEASLWIATLTAMGLRGQTGCEGTEWESETSVRYMLGQEAHASRRIIMTSSDRGGSRSAIYSVDPRGLSLTQAYNRAGTRIVSVTLCSARLDPTSFPWVQGWL